MTTLTGGPNDDILNGGSQNDVLSGLGGNDTLNGNGGNDQLDGGTGNDAMTGGIGNDVYSVDSLQDQVIEKAGEGTDEIKSTIALTTAIANVENYTFTLAAAVTFTGNDLNNKITGGTRGDTLSGGIGNDVIDGGDGADTLSGGTGNDTLTGGTGADKMSGGIGNDVYSIDSLQDQVTENSAEGTDEIKSTVALTTAVANVENYSFSLATALNFTGNDLNNKITGGTAGDTLNGGIGNDVIDGGAGDDTLNGGSGDDTLTGGTGADKLTGGIGNDIYSIDSAQDQVTENAGEGTDEIKSSIALAAAVANVENYTFSLATGVTFTGNDLNNKITGGSGADTLSGGIGNDTLNGGAGADKLTGGVGNDIYNVDSPQDQVIENAGEGNDEIRSTIALTAAVANVEYYTFSLATGVTFTGNDLSNRITGGTGDDSLAGGIGNDTLNGGTGNDTLDGGANNDVLNGGVGDDTMGGGAGDDLYYVNSAADQVIEASGGGTDEVSSAIALTTAFANVENYTFTGTTDVSFTGNALNNKITGSSGDDTLVAGAGNDTVNGGTGGDTLRGEAGNDVLNGGAGNDILEGGDNDDALAGGAGEDRLRGGAGNDTLTIENLTFVEADGGAGDDRLVFKGSSGFNIDLAAFENGRIKDIERIDLSQSGADQLLLTQASVQGASSTGDQLIVDGKAGDVVTLSGGFKLDGSQAVGGETYDRYTLGTSTVLLDKAVTAHLDAGTATVISLGALTADKGFTLASHAGGSLTGAGIGSAGDVNGDGYDDLIIGAPITSGGGGLDGAAYVVFGGANGPIGAVQDLSALNGSNGFRINGLTSAAMLGEAVTTAGDFNGDGIDDLLIGSKNGAQTGLRTGEAFVVFGTAAGFPATLDLSSLTGANGFRLHGVVSHGEVGVSVASAGDVNGDGYDDLLIGAPGETPHSSGSGNAYVVFGHAGAQDADIDLSALSGTTGFKISGSAGMDLGRSVSAAGDVNGDGYADILVGASGFQSFGGAYVIFGHGGSFGATLEASAINGSNGFILDGPFGEDVGRSVSTAGDLNGDGYDDLIVVERGDDSGHHAAYVVFGHGGSFTSTVDLGALNGTNGFTLLDPSGVQTWNVSAAGDFNGDGYADILVSAATGSGAAAFAGTTYLLYGTAGGFGATVDVTHLSAQQGLQINGAAAGDNAQNIAAAGDVNGDGYDDLLIGAPYADDSGSETGLGYVIYGGNTSATASHVGTTGNDTITGNSSAEIFVGGRGDDTLNGAGGADTFQGGIGNDHIHVTDRSFHLVDGGGGTDTLHFDFAGAIDFGNLDANAATADRGKIAGIEMLDVTNGQANALTLHAADVLDLNVDNRNLGGVASLDNVLKIDGDTGDTLKLFASDGWSVNTSILTGYNVYTEGAVKIAIDKDIAVTIG